MMKAKSKKKTSVTKDDNGKKPWKPKPMTNETKWSKNQQTIKRKNDEDQEEKVKDTHTQTRKQQDKKRKKEEGRRKKVWQKQSGTENKGR